MTRSTRGVSPWTRAYETARGLPDQWVDARLFHSAASARQSANRTKCPAGYWSFRLEQRPNNVVVVQIRYDGPDQ